MLPKLDGETNGQTTFCGAATRHFNFTLGPFQRREKESRNELGVSDFIKTEMPRLKILTWLMSAIESGGRGLRSKKPVSTPPPVPLKTSIVWPECLRTKGAALEQMAPWPFEK